MMKILARIILILLFVRLMGFWFLIMAAIIWGLFILSGWGEDEQHHS